MYINLVRRVPQRLALGAIRAYQRHLSPRKGFVCAFRAHTGRDGCSAYGLRVIGRYGLLRGLALLRSRLGDCGRVHFLQQCHLHRHRPHAQRHAATAPPLRRQTGFCDAPSCDIPGCELPSCHALGEALDGIRLGVTCGDACGSFGRERSEYRVSKAVKDKYKRNRPT